MKNTTSNGRVFCFNGYLTLMKQYDVVVVGGGLAGLTAAIDLRLSGHSVLVVEKKPYPHHKVCGEYVSNEIRPYLKSLGVDLRKFGAIDITNLLMSTKDGDTASTKLPLGGLGISRYTFDSILYDRALSLGADFIFQVVQSISFQNDEFKVVTDKKEVHTAKITIGAYGKRSGLDKTLKRDFIQQKSSWLGVKAHYRYNSFPNNLVALHNFKGGYGGLSRTESGVVNFCYLANYESFQKFRNISDFNSQVVAKNPYLATFLEKATPVFREPMTIAQISFEPKKASEGHVLMCGDTAGLIHPLCGNGMAMAIHGAKLASDLIHRYFENERYQRTELESDYQDVWNKTFRQRLWVGRKAQSILMNETLSKVAIATAVKSPRLLRSLIERTHGKPIEL